ncbi:MAG: ABC transporter permease subunit [Rhodocyclaceae bacterium]|nr:ABC transporter permease subunit [Rhodocyclaceae bacterium]MBK9624831.1 ABC transporter permease subunit [Rhodocyclaceae bacterium]MBL0076319.1 ABC transporter permease subunit [Rhodocyclaceae bacterium]MBP6279070.1 ABC transporter permease subunit [Rhodocyclaceae bacterium]
MEAAGGRVSNFGRFWLIAGYAFLYIPILTLIIYSFNDSKMVTLWGGFTFKWYGVLAEDKEVLDALALSLKLAFTTATSSVVLGMLGAFAMVRYQKFFGRTMFSAHLTAPLVVPEVITGLSLLLFFVMLQRAIGWPERGMFTIWAGHTSVGMAYAAVVIQSRLLEMDKSLEEAAQDLGCKPFQVFYLITLPMIGQALASAWLLTFTVSLDDVVATAFLSGPGSTTLPVLILSRAKLGLNPTINAIATITVAVVAVGVMAGSLWMYKQEKRRAAEQAAAYRDG